MWISYFKTQTSAPSTVDNLKALSGADFKNQHRINSLLADIIFKIKLVLYLISFLC